MIAVLVGDFCFVLLVLLFGGFGLLVWFGFDKASKDGLEPITPDLSAST